MTTFEELKERTTPEIIKKMVELAEINITKLFDRKDRNKLHGSGDNR